MRPTKKFATMLLAAALSIGMALPASAGPGHTSCKGFGQFFAMWAQGGAQEAGFKNGGQGIKFTALNGFEPIGAEPPGSVAQVIHWEQSLFCESK